MGESLEPDFTKYFINIKHQVFIILFKEYFQSRVESSKSSFAFAVFFQELRHQRLGGLTSTRLIIICGVVGYPKKIKFATRNMEYQSLS